MTARSAPRSNWERLYDIAEARMSELGMARDELKAHGGPSKSWFWEMQNRTKEPNVRMKGSLDELDVALGWPRGTSYRLARDPFDEGSPAAMDEEERLIHGDDSTRVPATQLSEHEQMIRDFATAVQIRLRGMPEVEAREQMIRLGLELGIPLGQHRPNG